MEFLWVNAEMHFYKAVCFKVSNKKTSVDSEKISGKMG